MPTPAAETRGVDDLARRVCDRLGTSMNTAMAEARHLTIDGLLEQPGVKR